MERKQALLATVLVIALAASVALSYLESFVWMQVRVVNTDTIDEPSE